jgi:hypothetical protein
MDAFCTQSKNPLHPTRKKNISETNFSFASVNLLSSTLNLLGPFYLGMTNSISSGALSSRPYKTISHIQVSLFSFFQQHPQN